ncbi:MAG: nuclear transport factor 2 family protein [Trueperaceae bacterium]|nr:nuclear transport factor 2 family protein [Trueperaceae bacterium]
MAHRSRQARPEEIPTCNASSNDERRVLAAEDDYVAAEVAGDEAALRRIADDRLMFNRSDGTTTGKEALIQAVLGMGMTNQTLRERTLLIEGDTALVFGTTDIRTADVEDRASMTPLRYTATYVQRRGTGCLLALQMQRRVPT